MSANNARANAATESSPFDLVIKRVFDAPRELVFKTWTEAKHVQHWWGPMGFTNPVCELDVRAGGAIRIDMRGPDGVVYPMTGVFEEIVPPERLVFISSALDAKGNSMFDILNTVTFTEQRGKTALTLEARVIKTTAVAAQYLKGMEVGWTQTLDRLANHLRSAKEEGSTVHLAKKSSSTAEAREGDFAITRVFDAPRELVFKALTEAERLAQWWGPKGCTISVRKVDLRPGGMFHYSMRSPQGEMWGKFVYREIVPPERLVFVNSFSNEQGDTLRGPFHPTFPVEVLNIVTLTEQDGKTTLTMSGRPINATEEEQKTYASFRESMNTGFAGTFDQLEEYLAKA